MAVDIAFLPSEIARLVYGFLVNEKCTETAKTFLQESQDLEECRYVLSQGKKFSSKVYRLALTDILEKYCLISCIVSEEIKKCDKLSRLKQSGDIIQQIKLVFEEYKKQQTCDCFNKPIQNLPVARFELPSSNNLNNPKSDYSIIKSPRKFNENLYRNNVVFQNIPENNITVQNVQSKDKNIPNERYINLNTNSAVKCNKNNLKVFKDSETQVSEINLSSKISKDVAVDTNNEYKRNYINTDVQTLDVGSQESDDYIFDKNATLELAEKIAGNINKVFGPIKSQEKTFEESKYMFLADFNKAVEETVNRTENDPEFLNLLSEIIPPAKEVISTEDEIDMNVEMNVNEVQENNFENNIKVPVTNVKNVNNIVKSQDSEAKAVAEILQVNCENSAQNNSANEIISNQPASIGKKNSFTETLMENDNLLDDLNGYTIPKEVNISLKKSSYTPVNNMKNNFENNTNDVVNFQKSPNIHQKTEIVENNTERDIDNNSNNMMHLLKSADVLQKSTSKSDNIYPHGNTVTSTPLKTMMAVDNFDTPDWFTTESLPSPNLGFSTNDANVLQKADNLYAFATSETIVTTTRTVLSPIVKKDICTIAEKVIVNCSLTNTNKDQTLHTPKIVSQLVSKIPNNLSTAIVLKPNAPESKTPHMSEKSFQMIEDLLKPGGTVESLSPLLKEFDNFVATSGSETVVLHGTDSNQAALQAPVNAPEIEVEDSQLLDSTGLSPFLKIYKKTDEKGTVVIKNNEIAITNEKIHRLSVIPEESVEGGSKNNSAVVSHIETIAKSTPKTLPEHHVQRQHLSLSTPKKPNRHVRALNFDTPYGRSKSDSKCNGREISPETLRRTLKNSTCKSSLFQSPPFNNGGQQSVETKSSKTDNDKQNNGNEVKSKENNEKSKPKSSLTSKDKENKIKINWDEELRKYANCGNGETESPKKRRHRKIEDPSLRKKRGRPKNSDSASKKAKTDDITTKKSEEKDTPFEKKNYQKSKGKDTLPKKSKKNGTKSKSSDNLKKSDNEVKKNIDKELSKNDDTQNVNLKFETAKDEKIKEINADSITLQNVDLSTSRVSFMPDISSNESMEKVDSMTEILRSEVKKKTNSMPQLILDNSQVEHDALIDVLLNDNIEVQNESDVIRLASEEIKTLNSQDNNEEFAKIYDEISKDKSIIEKMQKDEENMTAVFFESVKNLSNTNSSVDNKIEERLNTSGTPKATTPKTEVIYDEIKKVECGRVVQKKYARIKTIDKKDLADKSRKFKSNSITTDIDTTPSSTDESTMNSSYRSKQSPAFDITTIQGPSTPKISKMPCKKVSEEKVISAKEVPNLHQKEVISTIVEIPQNSEKLVKKLKSPSPLIEDTNSMLLQKPRTPCILSPGSSISLLAPISKVSNEDSHTITSHIMPVLTGCPPTPQIILTPEKPEDNASDLPTSQKKEVNAYPSALFDALIKKSDVTQFEVVKENLPKNSKLKSKLNVEVKKTDNLVSELKNICEIEQESTSQTSFSSQDSSCNCSSCNEKSSSSSSSSSSSTSSSSSSSSEENNVENESNTEKKMETEDLDEVNVKENIEEVEEEKEEGKVDKVEEKKEEKIEDKKEKNEETNTKVEQKKITSEFKSEISPKKLMPIHKTDLELANSMKETPARDENAEVEIHDTPNITKPIDNPTNLNTKISQMIIQKEREEMEILQNRAKPKIIDVEDHLPEVITKTSTPLIKALPLDIQFKAYEVKNELGKSSSEAPKIIMKKSEQEIKQAIESLTTTQIDKLNECPPETPNKNEKASPANPLKTSSDKRELVQAIESITKTNNINKSNEFQDTDKDGTLKNSDKDNESSDGNLELVLEDEACGPKLKSNKTTSEKTHNTRSNSRNQEQNLLNENFDDSNCSDYVPVLSNYNEKAKIINIAHDYSDTTRRRRRKYQDHQLTIEVNTYDYGYRKFEATEWISLFDTLPKENKRGRKRKADIPLVDEGEDSLESKESMCSSDVSETKNKRTRKPSERIKSKLPKKSQFIFY